VAGDRVDITKPVAGDLVAAGGEVTVSADVAGDLIVTGGKVRLAGTAQQDALVTGGEVTLAGTINRSARFGGGKVTLEPGARINGNATFGAGELNVAGEVTGYLLAGGGRIYINGPIGGDVRLGGGDIELGPDARIKGNLLYRSRNELKRATGAQVLGSVKRLPSQKPMRAPEPVRGVGLLLWWCIGLGVLAAILLATLPAFTKRVSSTARERPGWSLLFGFIALVVIPIACIIALVTVIGIPVGVLTFLAYPILLLVGYVLAAVALGDMALTRIQPDRADERSRRIIAALVALLILGLLARVPVLGGWVGLLVLLLGVGALLQQFSRTSNSVPATA
jgi:cytoskeletal protein CcmA (bactofilin family)